MTSLASCARKCRASLSVNLGHHCRHYFHTHDFEVYSSERVTSLLWSVYPVMVMLYRGISDKMGWKRVSYRLGLQRDKMGGLGMSHKRV